jgi:hypothetical protein
MRTQYWLLALILLIAVSDPAFAAPLGDGMSAVPDNAARANRVSVFFEDPGGEDLADYRVKETLALAGKPVDYPTVSFSELVSSKSGSGGRSNRKRMTVAVLLSGLLPGLGETYLYAENRSTSTLVRIPIFFGLEAYMWYGYYTNHKEGKNIKNEYMAYCDAHWSEERFLAQHPCCAGYGGCEDYVFYNTQCRDDSEFFLYTPKEEDEEEYYENAGKYDPFVYGWDDWAEWSAAGNDSKWTPHRSEYWAMRTESDDYLVKGDQYLMGLIVLRVVSMLDSAWIAYRMGKGEATTTGWNIELDSGLFDAKLAVSYRF